MYKASKRLLPKNIQKYFEFSQDNVRYGLRYKNIFKHQYSRTTKKAQCISRSGVKRFNSLDSSIKDCFTVTSFKVNYKRLICQSYSCKL